MHLIVKNGRMVILSESFQIGHGYRGESSAALTRRELRAGGREIRDRAEPTSHQNRRHPGKARQAAESVQAAYTDQIVVFTHMESPGPVTGIVSEFMRKEENTGHTRRPVLSGGEKLYGFRP
jgi:hypothetical protein